MIHNTTLYVKQNKSTTIKKQNDTVITKKKWNEYLYNDPDIIQFQDFSSVK